MPELSALNAVPIRPATRVVVLGDRPDRVRTIIPEARRHGAHLEPSRALDLLDRQLTKLVSAFRCDRWGCDLARPFLGDVRHGGLPSVRTGGSAAAPAPRLELAPVVRAPAGPPGALSAGHTAPPLGRALRRLDSTAIQPCVYAERSISAPCSASGCDARRHAAPGDQLRSGPHDAEETSSSSAGSAPPGSTSTWPAGSYSCSFFFPQGDQHRADPRRLAERVACRAGRGRAHFQAPVAGS